VNNPTDSTQFLQTTNPAPYLIQGAQLLTQPGFKRFAFLPILTNLVVFILCLMALAGLMSTSAEQFINWLPSWLQWLEPMLWVLLLIVFGTIYLFSFTAITNLIAAPFNGLLSEKTQQQLTNTQPPNQRWSELILRTLKREFQKLGYFISRGIILSVALLILGIIPLINLLAPIIGVIWACWVMAIQFLDYAADNNQVSFTELKHQCHQHRLTTLIFGGSVLITQVIPIVNLFVMSAAVAGGTVLWFEKFNSKASNT